jgi:transposase
VGEGGLAAPEKKARRRGAHLVLIDESGAFLNPLVRRTWAPRGRTPVLRGWGRHRDKVNVIAAVSISPAARRLGLYFQTDPKRFFDAGRVVGFLRRLLRRLRGRVMVVWDRGTNHKGPVVREYLAGQPRLQVEHLPAYAPELNPAEAVWGWLKHSRLCNRVPPGVSVLDDWVNDHLAEIKHDPRLLRQVCKAADLPLTI